MSTGTFVQRPQPTNILDFLRTEHGHAYATIVPHPASPRHCFTAIEIATGDAVFLKAFDALETSNKERRFRREVWCLQLLADAPYVCHLRHHAFCETRRIGLLVMDHATGYDTLLDLFNNNAAAGSRTRDPYAATMCALFEKLLAVLRDLERRQIVHADIKPENILCSPAADDVKLIDFEFAIGEHSIQTICGSFPYADYMLITSVCRDEVFHCTNDLWSLATTMYRMLLCGVPCDPYYDDTLLATREFRHNLRHWTHRADQFDFPPHYNAAAWSPAATRCIAAAERCLTPSYRSRPSIEEVEALLRGE